MGAFGAAAISRRMKIIERNARREMIHQLDENADDLLSRARQLAPQLSGELIESGTIRKRGSRKLVSRTIVFTACHAVRRHEDFYQLGPISSTKSSPDGPIGRKFLERPFEAHKDDYYKSQGAAVARALRQSLR
ncbi:MAG: hypothetical protein GY898_06120 [Proteobacteria bacterium]|nr:hypothetical protein [Pseudomonadota bacterium]